MLWVILSPGRMDLLKYAEMKVDLMKVIWRHEFGQDCLNIQDELARINIFLKVYKIALGYVMFSWAFLA